LIKGSKDSDWSLVSNKNFSETLWPSGWALGQVTWAKMTPKLFHLWRQSQKIPTPQPQNFFRDQSTRVADPFQPLNSSLAQSAEELGHWKGNRKLLFFRPKWKYEYIVHQLSKC